MVPIHNRRLKRVETKVYTQLSQSKGDGGTDDGETGVDVYDNLSTIAVDASVLIEVTPFPSQRPLSSPSSSQSQPRDQIENLKKHQEAQMQSLFDEQKRHVGGSGS